MSLISKLSAPKRLILSGAFAIASALATAGLVSYDWNRPGYLDERIPAVKKEFDEFPEQIPGAGMVLKYPVEDASYCLVHIKQRHMSPADVAKIDFISTLDDDTKSRFTLLVDDVCGRINPNQKDIYTILNSLAERNILPEFRDEGIANDYERDLLSLHYEVSLEKIVKAGNFEKEDPEKYRYAPSGLNLFTKERNIDIRRSEDLDALNKAVEAAESLQKKEIDYETFNQAVMENRENEFLKIMTSESEATTIVLVLGKDHDFGNNIEEWNKTHPYGKICHIVVYPVSFVKKTDIVKK